jgi:hypothetical protein
MALFKRRKTLRPPVADLDSSSVEAGGRTMALSEALVAARVEGRGLQVVVFHPVLADLPDEPRLEAAVEILIAAIGENALRSVVVDLSPATDPPIDPFGLPALRAFVISLGVAVEPGAE